MLRKVLGAAVVLVFCVGLSLADEIRCIITKVEGDKVTFTELKGKEKGDTRTLPVDALLTEKPSVLDPGTISRVPDYEVVHPSQQLC